MAFVRRWTGKCSFVARMHEHRNGICQKRFFASIWIIIIIMVFSWEIIDRICLIIIPFWRHIHSFVHHAWLLRLRQIVQTFLGIISNEIFSFFCEFDARFLLIRSLLTHARVTFAEPLIVRYIIIIVFIQANVVIKFQHLTRERARERDAVRHGSAQTHS